MGKLEEEWKYNPGPTAQTPLPAKSTNIIIIAIIALIYVMPS